MKSYFCRSPKGFPIFSPFPKYLFSRISSERSSFFSPLITGTSTGPPPLIRYNPTITEQVLYVTCFSDEQEDEFFFFFSFYPYRTSAFLFTLFGTSPNRLDIAARPLVHIGQPFNPENVGTAPAGPPQRFTHPHSTCSSAVSTASRQQAGNRISI